MDRIDTFLKRMPQGPEDWESELSSLEDVLALRDRLTLNWIPQEDRRLMTPERLFKDCEEHLYNLSRDDANEAEANFLKLVTIAASEVLIQDGMDILTIDSALRPCLVYFGQSQSARDRKTLQQLRRAVRLGSQLLQKLELSVNSRIYELPFRVRTILSIWAHLKKRHLKDSCDKITKWLEEPTRRPPSTWESSDISIPELVYRLLGGRISRNSVDKHLGLTNKEYDVEIKDQFGEIVLGPRGPELLKSMHK